MSKIATNSNSLHKEKYFSRGNVKTVHIECCLSVHFLCEGVTKLSDTSKLCYVRETFWSTHSLHPSPSHALLTISR